MRWICRACEQPLHPERAMVPFDTLHITHNCQQHVWGHLGQGWVAHRDVLMADTHSRYPTSFRQWDGWAPGASPKDNVGSLAWSQAYIHSGVPVPVHG